MTFWELHQFQKGPVILLCGLALSLLETPHITAKCFIHFYDTYFEVNKSKIINREKQNPLTMIVEISHRFHYVSKTEGGSALWRAADCLVIPELHLMYPWQHEHPSIIHTVHPEQG